MSQALSSLRTVLKMAAAPVTSAIEMDFMAALICSCQVNMRTSQTNDQAPYGG